MDKKKKNGESFSFMNLAEYFNAEELEVESSLIKVFPEERQLEIWQMSARAQPKHGLRVYVGTYFELVATAIYGGIHHQRFTLGCELDNEPDSTLVRKKRIIHRESKAVAPKGYMRISDEQMAKYCLTQMGKGKYKNPRIIVDIFRYGIDKLESNFLKDVFKREGMGGLVGKLAETTQYLVSMPFGIIEHAYWHQIPRVVSRYKGKINEEDERRLAEAYKSGELSSYRARAYKHQPCTKIASGALDSLITHSN